MNSYSHFPVLFKLYYLIFTSWFFSGQNKNQFAYVNWGQKGFQSYVENVWPALAIPIVLNVQNV